MKTSTVIAAALATLSHAAPTVLVTRDGAVSSELENGPCRDITFIFARGSTEGGNMGYIVGPQTCSALKTHYGEEKVACQGVGGVYFADLGGNLAPGGTYPPAIDEAERLFNLASTKCPKTVVLASGYSQGAAVMNSALGSISPNVQDQVAAAVLYGDTQNAQTGGRIPGFPGEETLIICAQGDAVCYGTLIITAAHLSYAADVPQAEAFFGEKIDALLK